MGQGPEWVKRMGVKWQGNGRLSRKPRSDENRFQKRIGMKGLWMGILLLEAGVALALGLLIVWWTWPRR